MFDFLTNILRALINICQNKLVLIFLSSSSEANREGDIVLLSIKIYFLIKKISNQIVFGPAFFELIFFLTGEVMPNIFYSKTLQKRNLILIKKSIFEKSNEMELLVSFQIFSLFPLLPLKLLSFTHVSSVKIHSFRFPVCFQPNKVLQSKKW